LSIARRILFFFACVSIFGSYALIAANSHQAQSSVAVLLFGSVLAMLGVLIIGKHVSARTVMLGSLLLCLIGLCGRPLFEDDHYRYLWDGYRTVTTGNPFGAAPELFFADENVPPPMQRVLDGINYPEVATIYGPGLQYVFALSYLMAPGNDVVLRALLAVAQLCLVGMLLRRQSAAAVALYAWNPLVFKEIALSGHPDVLVPMLLLVGWWLRAGWWCAILVGLATATKIVALVAWPLLLSDRSPSPRLGGPFARAVIAGIIASLTLLLTYLPFAGAASDLSGLNVFARDWAFNAALHAPLAAWLGDKLARATGAVLVMLIVVTLSWRARSDPEGAQTLPPLHIVFGVLLLFSPVINPWYLLWLLPFAVGRGLCWPWVASLAVLLAYVTPLNLGDESGAAFAMPAWARAVEWSAIAMAIGFDVYRARRHHQSPLSMKAALPLHGHDSYRP
jgi:alpha-1,6-mannosyltransferase